MYRKKGRSWTKHIDFMLLDVLCMQIAFIVSYICRFGLNNPYIDKDYRILAVAFLLIDFFVEIVSDAFKNVLKRGYLDEFIVTCKHVALVEIITTFFLFTTQMGEIYSRMSYYIMIPIYILVSYLGRMVLKKIIKKRGFASSKESLFVIAPEKLLRETLQGLKENGFGYTQIVAAATDADLNGKTICEIPIVANHDGIVDYACEEWVDEVLIPPCAESEYPYEMADIFLEMGIAVHRGITKNKVMAGSFNQIEKIGDYTVITASLNYARTTQLLAKRGMDILGGLVGCIITLIVTIFVGPELQEIIDKTEKVEHPFTVYTLGRICYQKNPTLFNEIAESLPDVKFVWIGDGELRDQLTSENIEITGWADRSTAIRYAVNADVFLLPSRWEGLPISLLESMYMKKACVVSNVIGNRDVIHNGENGFVCTKVEDFVKAIEECQGEVEKLTEHAYQDILKMYNTKVMAEQYSKKYETAMNR